MKINKFGFEKEFFVLKDGKHVLLQGELNNIPKDDCRWLAEARGEPHADPESAKVLFDLSVRRLGLDCQKHSVELVDAFTMPVPKELMRISRRDYGKNVSNVYFAAGKCYKNDKPRAGLHVHFDLSYQTDKSTHRDLATMPRIILAMDRLFAKDIKESKRVPGEYELKYYGFEYRSLPSTIDLDSVVAALYTIRDTIG
jgi:hypothetical protein